ncbi:GntR family transcriptional regulator [Pengzhenrongella sp.]|jgi:DNA-binding GntR family transcriptional regulator|uniref:GntR family transcriptional regulator n=1 Tax=Pengzhenrongella sp. TaxID=2888820 RepID=UPI002F937089
MSVAGASPQPPPGKKASARDQTLEILRHEIISLELPPGAPLSENLLAAKLGVSRTPVRESLILLREEGLVQVFPQLGTFVSRVNAAEVAQAQFIREAIECASLTDAVVVAGVAHISALREVLERQRDADRRGDIEDFFGLDETFHRELLRSGGHEGAWATVNSAKAHLDRARRMSLVEARPVATLIEQHTRVVDALEARDAGAATAALREHLRAVFDDVERIRAATPELFSDGAAEERPRRRVVQEW